MMPAPTISTGSPSTGMARSRPWQAMETGSYRLAPRSGIASGIGWSMESWAVTESAQPPPRSWVNPSERPELTMRLSRLRHDDVQPRAQLAHCGSIPLGRQGMHGSMTTRVPTATEQFGPASTTRPAVSWPRTNGKVPMEAKVGDGPVLCAKRCRSLPQIPPVVTWTRAHDGPGSSGSGTSVNEAGNAGSTMSNTTARTR